MSLHRRDLFPWLLALLVAAAVGCNVTPDGDDDVSDDDATDDDDDLDIYDIQQDGAALDEFVTLTDKVVTMPDCLDGGYGYFAVQEPEGGEYSGLLVFTFEDVIVEVDVTPGEVVTIAGTVTEYYDMTELTLSSASDMTVTGSTAVPEPAAVTAADLAEATGEAWESVLVELQSPQAVTEGPNSYGDWWIDGVKVCTTCYTPDPEPVAGQGVDKLVGVVLYDYGEFCIAPRDANDVQLGEVGPVETVTISDIRQGSVAAGPVRLEDVVVTSPVSEAYSSCEWRGFYVQEQAGGANSGIYVAYADADLPGFTVNVGDVVNLQGSYEEFYDLSEIKLAAAEDFEVVGSAAPPDAIVFDPCADDAELETYESVLVQVVDAEVTDENPDGPKNDYGEFEVGGCLRVDDMFMNDACGGSTTSPEPPASTVMTVTGVMHYAYNNYKLEPRGQSDFQGWTP